MCDNIHQFSLCRSDITIKVNFFLDLQTPTSKQSKYKEQVAEMRKGRNSGLQKEQKEKHMVHHWLSNMQLFTCCHALHLSLLQLAIHWFVSILDYISSYLCSFFYLHYRSIGRHTATPESLCWRTSPVIMTWSSSGKPRPVHLKIW